MKSRYARQLCLPAVGEKGQQRLREARVLVVGAGGLGSPLLQYLAGAGVGRLTVVDPDRVETANLHRQTLYAMAEVGRPKAFVARDVLGQLNPDCRVVPHIARLGPALARELVPAHDVVVDAADGIAVTYALSDACLAVGKPLVSASATGLAGHVGGFCGGSPSYRAVFPEPAPQMQRCDEAGVLGPLVGVVGSLQAQFTLSLLLGLSPSPLGRLVTVDLARIGFGGFSFHAAPEPVVEFPFIDVTQLREDDVVIELRDLHEAPKPVSPLALRVSMASLGALGDLPRGRRVVLCCRTGLRAWRAARQLARQGAADLVLLAAA